MKKITLNNIYEWPLITKCLLLSLVSLFIVYLGYQYDLSNQIQNLSRNIQQEDQLKQQVEFIIHKNTMAHLEIAQLPERRIELEIWRKQLINYKALPGLLNMILKIGGDNHLFFSLFTPGEPVNVPLTTQSPKAFVTNSLMSSANQPAVVPSNNAETQTTSAQNIDTSFYAKLPIKVVVVGDYHQVAGFLSQIANMTWIVVIKNFTLSNDNQSLLLGDKLAKQAEAQHLLSAELMLDVYYLPETK